MTARLMMPETDPAFTAAGATDDEVAAAQAAAEQHADEVAAGGIEIDYAEMIGISNLVNTTTATAINGLTVHVPAGPRPVVLRAFSPLVTCTILNSQVMMLICRSDFDGNLFGDTTTVINWTAQMIRNAANEPYALAVQGRIPPPDAGHDYQVRLRRTVGGDAYFNVGFGSKAFIQALQV